MTKNDFKNLRCWIITEGMAGTENQCIGVAEALGVKPLVKQITLREPWKTLSPTLGLEQWWSFEPTLYQPWPDILIASGRKSIAAARFIKKVTWNQTFTVQMQDPRVKPNEFDLVAVPFHDELRGPNVLVTTGAPNRITQERLKQDLAKFPHFKTISGQKLAVLIGGNSKTHRFTKEKAQELVSLLKKTQANLLMTISRRTPKNVQTYLKQSLSGENVHFWDGESPNPYFAYLACADAILVTSDSASMISEAATTGKPVYKFDLDGSSDKFKRFYHQMQKLGILRNFEGTLAKWDYEPLNDAKHVADKIREMLVQRTMQLQKTMPPPKPAKQTEKNCNKSKKETPLKTTHPQNRNKKRKTVE